MGKNTLKQLRTRLQNRTAAIIILAGALCGSFFVDGVQVLRGTGFSEKAVRGAVVIPHDGRTWVAYAEPIVPLTLIIDTACEECNIDTLVAWLQYTVPTVHVQVVDVRSAHGAALLTQYGLLQTPSLLFDTTITQTRFYANTAQLFLPHGDVYLFDLPMLNIVPTQYVRAPHVPDAIHTGAPNADVTVTLVGEFACTACAEAHAAITTAVAQHDGAVVYNFIFAPVSADDVRSDRAAEAAYCAAAQDGFFAYATELFRTQRTWRRSTDDTVFVRSAYNARLADVPAFQTCLTEGVFHDTLLRAREEVARLGTQNVPLVFVNDTHVADMDTFEDVFAAHAVTMSTPE